MELDAIVSEIPVIDENIRYWLIRTGGGSYFDTFYDHNRIAFGENFINPEDIKKLPKDKLKFNSDLLPIIEKSVDTKRPSVLANYFYRFYYEIKKNDIVLVPSVGSTKIRIAQIIDDEPEKYYFVDEEYNSTCPHIHARKVKWLAIRDKWNFNPNFIKLFFSHHAIVDAYEYSDFINAAMYDIYVKNGIGHLLLNVRTKDAIKAKSLFSLFSGLFEFSDDFIATNRMPEIKSSDIQTRTNLNSEGSVELITTALPYLVIVGTFVVALTGGTLKVPGLEFGSPGLLKPILEFLRDRAERKQKNEMMKAINELKVKSPKEIVDLLGYNEKIVHEDKRKDLKND